MYAFFSARLVHAVHKVKHHRRLPILALLKAILPQKKFINIFIELHLPMLLRVSATSKEKQYMVTRVFLAIIVKDQN